MGIYTKNGDNGMSELMNHTLISKTDNRFEALGTIDELSSHLGLLKCVCLEEEKGKLSSIQKKLMMIMAGIADETNNRYVIPKTEIVWLEMEIDAMEASFPRVKEFVLPGGCEKSARADVARTITRRAERCYIAIAKTQDTHNNVMQYLNRLSDYLYMFARWSDYQDGKSKGGINREEIKNMIETEVRKRLE